MRTVHSKEKSHKCDLCDYATSDRRSIESHKKCRHENVKPYKCDKCSYATALKYSLLQHIRCVHDEVKRFKCEECHFESNYRKNLAKHTQSIHNKTKKFRCKKCSYKSSESHDLTQHMKSCHVGKKRTPRVKSQEMSTTEQRQALELKTTKTEFSLREGQGSTCIDKREVTDRTFTECTNDDIKQFQCKECSYASPENHDLTQHVNSCHSSGEREPLVETNTNPISLGKNGPEIDTVKTELPTEQNVGLDGSTITRCTYFSCT